MTLLNMMLGLFELMIIIIIIPIVILIESHVIRIFVRTKSKFSKIIISVSVANLITTIMGFTGMISWVWNFVIDLVYDDKISFFDNETSLLLRLTWLLSALILTILIEAPINTLLLRKIFQPRKIFIYSIYANIVTYLILGFFTLIGT